MIVAVDRASVHPGDDTQSHARTFECPNGATLRDIITMIAESGWLASIAGGLATWSVASNVIVAVVAQQWREPKMMLGVGMIDHLLDRRDGVLHLYFNYHAQIDPKIVYDVLSSARMHA